MPTQESAEKIEAFMRDAHARGETSGFSASQLRDACGLSRFEATRVLDAGRNFVRIKRLNTFYWYTLDACPFPVKDLAKEDILGRVEAAKMTMPFVAALKRFMADRAPDDIPVINLYVAADEHDCRKAYAMIGPLPTVDEAKQRLEQVQAAISSNGSKSTSAPSAAANGSESSIGIDDRTWPFRISRQDASEQLEAGKARRCDQDAALDWVKHNLSNRFATPEAAPSNYAWERLTQAVLSPLQRSRFFEAVDKVESARKRLQDVETKREDDFRRQFKLFDAVEQELARQAAEKAGATM